MTTIKVLKFRRIDFTNRHYRTTNGRYELSYDGKTWTIEISHAYAMGFNREVIADGFRTRKDAITWFESESLKGINTNGNN